MLFLAIPAIVAVAAIGKAIYDWQDRQPERLAERSPPAPCSILERNLNRLGRELSAYAGPKVAVFGQPGAGKSSLLLKMSKGEITPHPVIGTKTDATTWAIDDAWPLLNFHRRYAFVDVPGYDTQAHPATAFESNFPFNSVDANIFVVSGKIHAADLMIFAQLVRTGKPICIARSFSDSLDNDEKLKILRNVRSLLAPDAKLPIVFFSNRTGRGVQPVYEWIREQFAD